MKPVSLYTSSFRVIIKRIGSMMAMVAVAVFFLLSIRPLDSIDYIWPWSRFFWNRYYAENNNIDSVFIGSSHVFCDINPDIIDNKLGGYHWNMSNNGMRLNSAYSILKECVSKNDIKNVYLELFYWCSTNDNGETYSKESYFYNSMNADYRRKNANNIELLLTMGKPEQIIDTLFPSVRYKQYLLDSEHIKNAMTDYYTFEPEKDTFILTTSGRGVNIFKDRGYWYSDCQMLDEERCIDKDRELSEGDALTESAEKYLRRIIEYCRDNGIEITLFCSPMYDLQIASSGDYDAYLNDIRSVSSEYGINFYDFNLVKEEYLDIQHIENYKDVDHLNTTGATIFSEFFSDVILGKIDPNDAFYRSYESKMKDIKPEVYGLYYTIAEDGKTYYIASNRQEGIEYSIQAEKKDGTRYNVKLKADNCFEIIDSETNAVYMDYYIRETEQVGTLYIKL